MVGCNAQGATIEKVTFTDSSLEATWLDKAVVRMSAWDGVGIHACDLWDHVRGLRVEQGGGQAVLRPTRPDQARLAV